MSAGEDGVLVSADPRSRVSLARLGVDGGQIYRATLEEDGTIRLEPMKLVPASEVRP
jgi:hypothetical protein